MTQFEQISEKFRNFFGSISGQATQPGAGYCFAQDEGSKSKLHGSSGR
jgi:hypothetical protein